VLHRDRIVKLRSLIISTKNKYMKERYRKFNFKSCRNSLKYSGVARVETLGRISTLFAVVKNALSRNLDQRIPKKAYFFE